VVTSHADREALIALDGGLPEELKPIVVQNGVDLSYFTEDEFEKREPATLVISGKMSCHANIRMVTHFMNHILPLIQASRPDVRVYIVSKDPPADTLSLGGIPRKPRYRNSKRYPPLSPKGNCCFGTINLWCRSPK
jgi:hypothetical protein